MGKIDSETDLESGVIFYLICLLGFGKYAKMILRKLIDSVMIESLVKAVGNGSMFKKDVLHPSLSGASKILRLCIANVLNLNLSFFALCFEI